MSFSRTPLSGVFTVPIAEFEYRQIAPAGAVKDSGEKAAEENAPPEVRLSEKSFLEQLAGERAAGMAQAEAGLRQEFQRRSEGETAKISRALAEFEAERRGYFARVEAEVVQLALAIAGKIIHREAQVDPLLVAAIVQIALGQLKDGAAASIRVRPEEAQVWRERMITPGRNLTVSVVGDRELEAGDCVLETELGKVNFSLDAQLKEVERGFLDVLAKKPQV